MNGLLLMRCHLQRCGARLCKLLRLGEPNDDESLSIIIPEARDSSLKNN